MKEMKNKAAPAAVSVPGAAIAGALFDFCGYLTTLPRQQAITASEAHEASPMVEALEQWSTKRNLPLDDADVKGWCAALAATPVQDVVLPEPAIMPKGEIAAAQLRAMATNYPAGHSWDKLDGKACIRGALEIEALRALLATATAPTEPFGYFKAEPFGWTDCGPDDEGAVALYEKPQAMLAIGGQAQAVEQGEVLVTVSGFTGSGKSAIAGEIEIMCRALGLQVEWPDGDSEKNMTHADWTAALEQYKPRVRIVECNVPHSVVKGQDK